LLIFKKLFNYYFEIFVLPFYHNRIKTVNKSLFQNYNSHHTFNYTPTYERFFSNKIKTSFIHGKIDSETDNLVLGVSEFPKGFEKTNVFLTFTKSFQKINLDIKPDFQKKFQNKPKDRKGFFFYGHSMDRSDKDFIIQLFNIVILETEIQNLIVVLYHNKKSKSILISNLLSIIDKKHIESLIINNKLFFTENNSQEHQELLTSLDITPPIRYF
jgi:hypothetical protein